MAASVGPGDDTLLLLLLGFLGCNTRPPVELDDISILDREHDLLCDLVDFALLPLDETGRQYGEVLEVDDTLDRTLRG